MRMMRQTIIHLRLRTGWTLRYIILVIIRSAAACMNAIYSSSPVLFFSCFITVDSRLFPPGPT
ncbi:amidophosphoribosyltransferase [Histoplasma capsulatum var. duboisii H88]|uniref:Amidophosphoribosyltransferase n=1 Tax=Ajellomyces capsulatus (strain H88) TaxID=544711 RepID=A0A8A1LB89_AJEC8|nr:amidophosphoribosyltransferase [Histoplasma capsulatum var. duboisii H88]